MDETKPCEKAKSDQNQLWYTLNMTHMVIKTNYENQKLSVHRLTLTRFNGYHTKK